MKNLLCLILLGGLFSVSVFAQSPPGAVGIWRMDENTGTTTADASGNNNNGTLNGAAWTTGVSGSAIDLRGNSQVDIADNAALRPGNISWGLWIRTAGTASGNQVIIGKSDFSTASNEQYVVWLDGSGRANMSIKRNSGCAIAAGWYNVVGTSNIDDQQWHHIVGTWDGTTARMYVDGALQGANAAIPAGNIDNCVGGSLRFGIWWQNFPDRYAGDIDEVHLYDRALTQTEVTQLFNAPNANAVPTLGQWGLIIFGLTLLCAGAIALHNRPALAPQA